MAYLALYRKYRPTTFDGLIGQEHVVKTLANQILSDRLGHAYLFTGTRGTGKTSAAKIFAKAINCLNPVNGSPCGECEACRALADPSNIDVIEIDAASNNGVNEIRELREKVQYPPVSCRYKVYIVDEVHMLTGAAFNALLKTLEEPPKHAVFILATTEVHKIPATILSRCMRFDFRLISTERISDLICGIYDELGKKYQKEAVFAIAKAGEGSIRDALSIADIALSYGENKLTYDDVMEILGSSNFEVLTEFVSSMISGNVGNIFAIINKLCSMGKSMGVLTKDVNALIRDLLVVKTCDAADKILLLPESKFSVYKKIADSTNEQRLLRMLEVFSDAESMLKYTNHPRVVFETAAIKSSTPENDYNLDALLSRIKTLEDKIEKGVMFSKAEEKLPTHTVTSLPNEQVVETVVEERQYVKDESQGKLKINELDEDKLIRKLSYCLEKNNSELIAGLIEKSRLVAEGKQLTIICNSMADMELLNTDHSKLRIKQAAEDFEEFSINVVLSKKEKELDEVDQATERIKKIFGDDIVITN